MQATQEVGTPAIAVQVTQWRQLPHIDDVEKFSDADLACLREVREVLARHQQLSRFGVTLLHTHFEVAEDEFMLETTDVAGRVQTIRPVKAADYAGRDDITLIPTSMKLADGEEVVVACTICAVHKGHPGHGPS